MDSNSKKCMTWAALGHVKPADSEEGGGEVQTTVQLYHIE